MKILFPKKSRESIFEKILNNGAPKDFFYGCLSSEDFDINKTVIDTRPSKKILHINFYDKIYNKIFKSNFSFKKAKYIFKYIPPNSKVISFVDWESLNTGLFHKYRKDLKLICGFHGLINFFERTPENIYFDKKKIFTQALGNMHHIFFFGPEDRKASIDKFGIPEKKTSVYRFGVDTGFWKKQIQSEKIDVLSVGSDLNRNYSIFKKIEINFNLNLITRLKIKGLEGEAKIISGSRNDPILSNLDLKNYYNTSKIVVIPLKETLQPSGYSVALQAMACGKPVIMTKIKGLWDTSVLKNMKNIIFVKPNDPDELNEKIQLLLRNEKLRKNISLEARKTAENYYSLDRMNDDFKNLINI